MVRIPYEKWNLIKHTPEFWADYDDNISLEEREIGVIHFSEYADPANPDLNNVVYFTALPKFLLDNFRQIAFHDDILSEALDIFKNLPDRSVEADIVFNWDMRPEQIPLIKDVMEKKEHKGYINGLIVANPGFGKGLPVKSRVPTPNGWKIVGQINEGDFLFDKYGYPTKVLGVYPQGLKDIYKLTFDDGTFNLCDDEHLWEISNSTEEYCVISAQNLHTAFLNNNNTYYIDLCSPVTFNPQKPYHIPPKVKGCFISQKFGHNVPQEKKKINYNLTLNYKAISLNDRIPDNFKFESISIRKELLSNILYNDEFVCTSRFMTDDIIEIIQSLGIWHYPVERTFYYDEEEEAEVEYYTIKLDRSKTKKRIVNIEKTDVQAPTVCFKVDNHEHLFLCNNYTVTHNTASSIKLSSIIKKQTCVVVPNDLLEKQWYQAILKSTNLTEDDISVIQGSDMEKLNRIDVYDKPFVIVKVQSLLSQVKTFNLQSLYELYSRFGLVFYDEVHTSGSAESYAKTSFIFETKNIIGLSATPYVKGINKFLLTNGIGPVIHHSDHQNLIANVHMHHFWCDFTEYEINKLRMMMNDYIMFMAILNSILESKQSYFDYLYQWIVYYRSQNRKIVVLFNNNKLITKMAATLKVNGYGDSYGILIGETKGKKKKYPDYISEESYNVLKKYYTEVFPKKKKIPVLSVLKIDSDPTPNIIKYKFNSKLLNDINIMNTYLSESLHIAENVQIKIEQVGDILTEREISGEKDIILSNFTLLKAGADFPELSVALFGSLVIGKITVNQSIGRITRVFDGKPTPDAHFFFPWIYTQFFKTNHFILTNNIKVQFPTTKFSYENFPREEKFEPVVMPTIESLPKLTNS